MKSIPASFPSAEEITLKFLDLVHYDSGGRIFTYVLTLDGIWRFTETGKEFSIDLLSKHTMHSDVSIYVAWAGEFFVRRLKRKDLPPPDVAYGGEKSGEEAEAAEKNEAHPPNDIDGGPPKSDPPKDPGYYELVIDNDSGTYRPQGRLLPILKSYMEKCLPGLKVVTLDCNAEKEKMETMKKEQRETKASEGDEIVFKQGDDDTGSISSSDEEDLDALAVKDGDRDRVRSVLKDRAKMKQKAKVSQIKKLR
jgi:hypothetical protein